MEITRKAQVEEVIASYKRMLARRRSDIVRSQERQEKLAAEARKRAEERES